MKYVRLDFPTPKMFLEIFWRNPRDSCPSNKSKKTPKLESETFTLWALMGLWSGRARPPSAWECSQPWQAHGCALSLQHSNINVERVNDHACQPAKSLASCWSQNDIPIIPHWERRKKWMEHRKQALWLNKHWATSSWKLWKQHNNRATSISKA